MKVSVGANGIFVFLFVILLGMREQSSAQELSKPVRYLAIGMSYSYPSVPQWNSERWDESIPLPGTYLKKRGQKLTILSACMITTGFAGFILANNVIPPETDLSVPIFDDGRADVQVLSTFLIAGGIALSIPAIHIWHKGQKRMNKSKLN